ncbi:TPA: hypothetical protein UL242_002515 [Clostridioides difficile]|uniref:hypothetical protein n=1 Tax=Clostridioides difficile TaxID=1496 RepID=UPI000BB19B1C|nr:hypothetical protein [Clostridioides difficile]EGT3642173.1 hypothetical protein [Clostridioides difficile]MBH7168541.1 hypothetical protein [Clostridioides difficile]MBY1346136.1 hypothetical protein [Clostridioides difficile]MCM0739674.1 hypothetical protein [Clostridioides difficile]MCW0772833.1 hypothetical protein [Clostridioides difficile]
MIICEQKKCKYSKYVDNRESYPYKPILICINDVIWICYYNSYQSKELITNEEYKSKLKKIENREVET